MSAPRRIGPYTVQSQLGRGGNATVWRATTAGGDPVAVKVLSKPKDPTAYERFRREITAVAGLQHLPGVLPLLDHHLPKRPDEADPAWLAMPIAQPIVQCLGDRPVLVDVVQVIADLAGTLAAVAAAGIAHRDVKPGNLYCHQGRAAVGDFGLVQLPEQEPLTTDARAVGPRNFHAPEMFTPAGTSGQPADVYSLAKTLWVLATAQRVPPLGEQRVDVVGPRLSDHVPHPDGPILDALIERCTRWDPARRPTMVDVHAELASWLRLQSPPAGAAARPAAPADSARRILAIASSGLSKQERIRQAQAEAAEVWASFRTRLLPATALLVEAGLPVQYADLTSNNQTLYGANEHAIKRIVQEQTGAASTYPTALHGSAAVVAVPRDSGEAHFWCGGAVAAFGDHIVVVASNAMRLSDEPPTSVSVGIGSGPAASATLREAVEEVGTAHTDAVNAALEHFAQALAHNT